MTPEQAATVTEFLLPQIEQEIETTARVISAVPDDKKTYTPHDTCMKAGDLAEHIACSDMWFLESVIAGEFGPFPEASGTPTADVASTYKARGAELVEKIKKLSGEHLAKPVTFVNWTLPNVTFLQVMMKHSVHHRGQLTAYLRPMGAKVPSIYGGSADEPFTATA
ncbi:MAG TPA: DinB family protein [Bryobacteraceae bacterium]|nr:DinB family protein [Bryobacteraceae bacterium]